MSINGLLMNDNDNVVVCTKELNKGDVLQYKINGEEVNLEVMGNIPVWNKIAIRSITQGENILKYGEIIGQSINDINCGECVSHLNVMSMPRNYDDEIK